MSDTTATVHATAHKLFSLTRVLAIAGNTFRDLVRQKVFYFMVVFALILIGTSLGLVALSFKGQLATVMDVSLGAMQVFSMLLAVLATAMLIPKDMEDRTLYTILAKPVARFEYLLGKLAGVGLVLLVAMALMTAFFCATLAFWQAREMERIANELPVEQVAESEAAGTIEKGTTAVVRAKYEKEVATLKASTFTPTVFGGVGVIVMRAMVCAALTLMISCFATSWLFTVIVSFMMIMVGHLVPIARGVWQDPLGPEPAWHIGLFLKAVTVFFPDMQLFNVVDDIATGAQVSAGVFGSIAGLGAGYAGVYLLVGYLFFIWREL
jgi:ABC-2 type transport system permease protein